MKKNVYDLITVKIEALLNQGIIPWKKPWKNVGGGEPTNLVSKKAYRGINVFLLGITDFTSQYWLTFNQAKKGC